MAESRRLHFLEFHGYRFAICGVRLEELPLLEAEHPRQNVGRERLYLRVEVAHDGIVVTARVLNGVFDLAEGILQLRELLRSLQLRIILGDGKQALERSGELIFSRRFIGGAGRPPRPRAKIRMEEDT